MIKSATFPVFGSGQMSSVTPHSGTATRGNFHLADGGPTVPPKAHLDGRERWHPEAGIPVPAGESGPSVPSKAYFTNGRLRLQALIDRQQLQENADGRVSAGSSKKTPVPKPAPKKMVIYVHGTFDSAATQAEGYAEHGGKELPVVLANIHGADKFHSHGWSGGPTEEERDKAGLQLVSTLSSLSHETEIALVGHSHGGNVIGHALNILVRPDDHRSTRRPNIVSVDLYGTPHWEAPKNPAWSLDAASLAGNITNYYSTKDSVQTLGANLANKFDLSSSSAGAGRTLDNPFVKNVDVTEHGEGWDHHSSLMTAGVLREIHAEELQRRREERQQQHRAWFGSHTGTEETP